MGWPGGGGGGAEIGGKGEGEKRSGYTERRRGKEIHVDGVDLQEHFLVAIA